MIRRYGALTLAPGLALAVFLVALLRRHGYEGVSTLAWLAAGAAIVAALAGEWLLSARLLERLAGIKRAQALRLGLAAQLPFLALLVYFLPGVERRPNVGTLLLFSAVAGCLAVEGAVLACYRRKALAALWARPYLTLGLITGLALLLRLGPIAANRFHADEALYSHWGLLIATGRDIFLRSELVDKPFVFPYVLALSFKLFGPTETAARIPNLVASVACVPIVYALGQALYDRRAGALAALFLALSPFAIQFAPTAFTDPLMVTLALAACLAAVRRHYLVAGLAMGLAVMTKLQAALFAPLLLGLAGPALLREARARRLLVAGPHLAMGLGAVGATAALWEMVIRAGCPSTFAAGNLHYGGVKLVPLAELAPRLQGWLGYMQYFTGSTLLNGALVGGVLLLLAHNLLSRGRPGWRADCVLAGFALSFVALHTVVSFAVWDRYLLGLAPVLALLAARVVLLPYDALLAGRAARWGRPAYGVILALALAIALLPPGVAAAQYRFPLGGDHGAHQGLDDVAAYLRGNAPPGSLVFHQWLDWEFSFYLFDLPLRTVHYISPQALVETAQTWVAPARYVVFASAAIPAEVTQPLEQESWSIEEVYRTYRPDGSVSFLICRLRPPSLGLMRASPSLSWPTTCPGPACRRRAMPRAPGA